MQHLTVNSPETRERPREALVSHAVKKEGWHGATVKNRNVVPIFLTHFRIVVEVGCLTYNWHDELRPLIATERLVRSRDRYQLCPRARGGCGKKQLRKDTHDAEL